MFLYVSKTFFRSVEILNFGLYLPYPTLGRIQYIYKLLYNSIVTLHIFGHFRYTLPLSEN